MNLCLFHCDGAHYRPCIGGVEFYESVSFHCDGAHYRPCMGVVEFYESVPFHCDGAHYRPCMGGVEFYESVPFHCDGAVKFIFLKIISILLFRVVPTGSSPPPPLYASIQ